MRNSVLVKWLLVACSLAVFSHLVLPNPQARLKKSKAVSSDRPHSFLEVSEFYTRNANISDLSDIAKFQTADAFLPYFALLSDLPDITASEAVGTCDYSTEELQSFVFDGNKWWKLNEVSEGEVRPLREQWQSFIQHGLIPWSSVLDQFSGKGIVLLAGDEQSVQRLKVSLRVLRMHLDISIPVEVHYVDAELSEKAQSELVDIFGSNIYFNDLYKHRRIWQLPNYVLAQRGINFQLKVAAIMSSRFQEVLYMDSDNLLVMDPDTLFDSNTYQTHGSVFWPDLTRTRPENPAYRITNTPCRRDEYEFESGQIMVDKSRMWYHLQLVSWLHRQPYWQQILLGDKDLFRFAWHALKTPYGRPRKWITNLGFVAEQPNDGSEDDGEDGMYRAFCGHTYAQHHPDHSSLTGQHGSGIAFLHGGNLKKMSAPLIARLRAGEGGVFTHYKSVEPEQLENWNHIEYGVTARVWRAGWYFNLTNDVTVDRLVSADDDLDLDGEPIGELGLKRLQLTDEDLSAINFCADMKMKEARPVAELGWQALGFETLFSLAGGYWTIEAGHRP